MPTSRSNENLQRGYQLNYSFSKILYYTHVLRLLFRLLLADPDPGPLDLDSCNPISLLKVICILCHKTSVGRFILQIGAFFCGVLQHLETKVVDR